MKFTAKQIAGLLGGQVEGNPEACVSKLSGIEEGVPESLCFLGNPHYNSYLYTSLASVVLVRNDYSIEKHLD
jgi:UDP-3-O-[3-hydroxymyristoyl] glucosamine N-acyltransferase